MPSCVERAGVDQAGVVGEEAEVERADEAADEVDAHDVERVVEAELELQVDGEGADGAGEEAEHDAPRPGVRAAQAGVIATRPATAPEAAPTEVALPSLIFSTTSQPRMAAAGAASVLSKASAAMPSAASLGAGVEAEPAEPQEAGAEQDEGRVVRLVRALGEADALAEHERQGEGRGTGVDVHRGAAGEVDDAHRRRSSRRRRRAVVPR